MSLEDFREKEEVLKLFYDLGSTYPSWIVEGEIEQAMNAYGDPINNPLVMTLLKNWYKVAINRSSNFVFRVKAMS